MEESRRDRTGNDDGEALQGLRRWVIVGLCAIGLLAATDLLLDRPTTLWSAHVLLELAMAALSFGGALFLWRGWRRTAEDLGMARLDAAQRATEAEAWQRKATLALDGLARAIDEEFLRWGLTPAEREVALLLLQGSGHKQIAGATGRSERTVRQHAVAVYEKSGLGGRAELAAYFLRGLRLPS